MVASSNQTLFLCHVLCPLLVGSLPSSLSEPGWQRSHWQEFAEWSGWEKRGELWWVSHQQLSVWLRSDPNWSINTDLLALHITKRHSSSFLLWGCNGGREGTKKIWQTVPLVTLFSRTQTLKWVWQTWKCMDPREITYMPFSFYYWLTLSFQVMWEAWKGRYWELLPLHTSLVYMWEAQFCFCQLQFSEIVEGTFCLPQGHLGVNEEIAFREIFIPEDFSLPLCIFAPDMWP